MPLPPVGVPPPPPPPSPPGPDSPEDVDVDAPPEIIEPSLPGEHAPVRDPQPPATMH